VKDFFVSGDEIHNTDAMLPGTPPVPHTITVSRNNNERILFPEG
jgi:hypothetical protein